MIKEDYPGYKDKTKDRRYSIFYDSLRQTIKNETNAYQCYLKLNSYVLFFRDRHLTLGLNSTKIEKSLIADTYSNIKNEVNPIEDDAKKPIIKGFWELKSNGTYYKIRIVGNEKEGYTGLIVSSDSLYWFPGQVKLFLQPAKTPHQYVGRFFSRDHTGVDIVATFLSTDVLDLGSFGFWTRFGGEANDSTIQSKIVAQSSIVAEAIDTNTLYLRIPSFDIPYYSSMKRIIDSLKTSVIKPNLILDLRNNSGGSKLLSNMLLDYVYTQPIKMSGFSFKTSKRNIEDLESLINNAEYADKVDTAGIRQAVKEYRTYADSLYPVEDDYEIRLDSVFSMPRKVFILVNRFSASATEYFLLQARQSRKVNIVGENTRGAIDYTDLGSPHYLPCTLFFYRTPRYRSNRVDKQPLDGVGITPDVQISVDEDALFAVKKILGND